MASDDEANDDLVLVIPTTLSLEDGEEEEACPKMTARIESAGPNDDLQQSSLAAEYLRCEAPMSGDERDEGDDHRKKPPEHQDSLQEENDIYRGDTFSVDDSDFEILDDEDEDLDDDVKQKPMNDRMERKVSAKGLESPRASPPRSPPQSPTEPQTPPQSPVKTPPQSPPNTPNGTDPCPSTPQGRFMESLNRLSTLSPKGNQRLSRSAGHSEKPKIRILGTDMVSPFGNFKIKRVLKAKSNHPSVSVEEWMREAPKVFDDGSSEDSSDDDDSESIGDNSQIFEDDIDQVVDFSTLRPLPNSFLNLPPDVYDYLDPDLVKTIGGEDISTFAWEHHLLVKGLMQLLAERDHIGVEGDVQDTSNVLKMGPLKKRYAQIWFVKYVEVRKGNLTYYGDSKTENSSRRTTVHLRKRTCTCQAVTNKEGFSFELLTEGHPKSLWMAKSEEERSSWIRAINQAMIGETDDSLDAPLDLTQYQNAIDVYQSVQSSLQEVKTQNDYTVAVDGLLYRQRSSSALRLPMKWIREQVVTDEEHKKEPDAPHKRVQSNISDFWKSLCSTSVSINGFLVEANSAYSGERVIGSLSRAILEFDKVEKETDQEVDGVLNSMKQRCVDSFVTEVEAVSYARTILTGILRSKVRGGAYSALGKLVRNDVASVKLESAGPVHIDVSFAGDDFSDEEPYQYDMSGWVSTRLLKKNKAWKDRYFVVSEGVLSFYQNADPRPYGLKGQLVLGESEVKTDNDKTIIQIQIEDQERQLRFDDHAEFLKWKEIIERAKMHAPVTEGDSNQRKKKAYGAKLLKGATGGGKIAMKAMKGAKKSIKSAGGKIKRGIRGNPYKNGDSQESGRRRPTTDMFRTSTMNLQEKSDKREPTVQVVVELNSTFKVVSSESSSEEEDLL